MFELHPTWTGIYETDVPAWLLWQELQLKTDMFDYLCWLDGMNSPEELHGVDRLCVASDGTLCWSKDYASAVRVAMEHDKEIFDAMRNAKIAPHSP